ncbi:MAG: hypothetical protein V5A68_04550 [Candidatus Thermoplasmatota archaeon]
MNKEHDFRQSKKAAITKFKKAKQQKKVDEKIIDILDLINSSPLYYTSSSCAGRIILMQIPKLGDKKNAVFLGRWHHKIDINKLSKALAHYKKGQLWLIAQSPIFHISAKTIKEADRLLKMGLSCGFKHSGIKSFTEKIMVEIVSTERIDIPLGKDKEIFFNKGDLDYCLEYCNQVIDRSDKKLERLKSKLKEEL